MKKLFVILAVAAVTLVSCKKDPVGDKPKTPSITSSQTSVGSGKTELALNFAFNAAERGLRTELLDLDMVKNPFVGTTLQAATHFYDFTLDGIETLENEALDLNNSKIFDLQGRQMDASTLKKGIYIINGKKVIIR